MKFSDKYTTAEKVFADTTGKEAKKTVLSNEGYAMAEVLETMKGEIKAILRGMAK